MRCNVCGRFLSYDKAWFCEACGEDHCPECSGEYNEGYGEYPYENAYSVCVICFKEAFNNRRK